MKKCPSAEQKKLPRFGSTEGGQGVDLCVPTHRRIVLPVAHLHLERRKPGGLSWQPDIYAQIQQEKSCNQLGLY